MEGELKMKIARKNQVPLPNRCPRCGNKSDTHHHRKSQWIFLRLSNLVKAPVTWICYELLKISGNASYKSFRFTPDFLPPTEIWQHSMGFFGLGSPKLTIPNPSNKLSRSSNQGNNIVESDWNCVAKNNVSIVLVRLCFRISKVIWIITRDQKVVFLVAKLKKYKQISCVLFFSILLVNGANDTPLDLITSILIVLKKHLITSIIVPNFIGLKKKIVCLYVRYRIINYAFVVVHETVKISEFVKPNFHRWHHCHSMNFIYCRDTWCWVEMKRKERTWRFELWLT